MDGVGLEFLETTLESLCTSAEHVIVADGPGCLICVCFQSPGGTLAGSGTCRNAITSACTANMSSHLNKRSKRKLASPYLR